MSTYRYVLKIDERLYYGLPFASDKNAYTLVAEATAHRATDMYLYAIERRQDSWTPDGFEWVTV